MARRKTTAIDANTPAKAAVRRLMSSGAATLARRLRAVMQSDDPEGPHQARVALRRLRVALDAFKPIVAKAVYRDLRDRMRAAFRSLGRLRDADVLALAMNLPDLHAAATMTRASVRADLGAAHTDRLATRILRAFAGKMWRRRGTKSARNAATAPLAATALTGIWHDCRAFGPNLTALPEETRHALRKSLKSLRYLGDHCANLWPGPAQSAFLARLRRLQDDLGSLNDQAMARARGFAVPEDPQTLAAAQSHWADLRHSAVWWPAPRRQ